MWGTCCRSTAPSPRHARTTSNSAAVTVTGTYEESGQGLVRQRSVDDDVGYLVLTPLRTSDRHRSGRARVHLVGRPYGRGHRTGATQRNAHDRRPSDAGRDHVGQGGPVTGRPDQLDQRQRAVQPTRRAGLRRIRRAVRGPTRNFRGWSPSRSRTCRIRPAARSNRSTSPTSSSGTCSPRLPWPRRSSWPAPNAGGSAPSWTTRRPRSRRRTPKRPGSLTATDAPRTDPAGARVCRTSALAAS